MNHIFQRDIYCHQLINPPAYDRSCDIDLQLSKSEGLIDLEKNIYHHPNRYIQLEYLIFNNLDSQA
jgi:hypothetical protein